MRDSTIARNYAETLLVLARRAEDLRGWGKILTDVSSAIQQNPTLRLFLESPKVSAAQKSEVVGKAFADRMPRLMLRFFQTLITHRRQMLIPEIAEEYMNLVDEAEGRIHARVTVAKETDDAGRDEIAQHLSRVFGKQVVPHLTVDPSIMGGVVVHVGDTVLDGSVKKRLASLRRKMLTGR
jgi:F-type H+-transporting ATPase subunit delta